MLAIKIDLAYNAWNVTVDQGLSSFRKEVRDERGNCRETGKH